MAAAEGDSLTWAAASLSMDAWYWRLCFGRPWWWTAGGDRFFIIAIPFVFSSSGSDSIGRSAYHIGRHRFFIASFSACPEYAGSPHNSRSGYRESDRESRTSDIHQQRVFSDNPWCSFGYCKSGHDTRRTFRGTGKARRLPCIRLFRRSVGTGSSSKRFFRVV